MDLAFENLHNCWLSETDGEKGIALTKVKQFQHSENPVIARSAVKICDKQPEHTSKNVHVTHEESQQGKNVSVQNKRSYLTGNSWR